MTSQDRHPQRLLASTRDGGVVTRATGASSVSTRGPDSTRPRDQMVRSGRCELGRDLMTGLERRALRASSVVLPQEHGAPETAASVAYGGHLHTSDLARARLPAQLQDGFVQMPKAVHSSFGQLAPIGIDR